MKEVFFDALTKMGKAANKETYSEYLKTTQVLYKKYIQNIKIKKTDNN